MPLNIFMRMKQILSERVATQTYFHITDGKNVPAILKKGLVPKASNDGYGNYGGEWESLNGVYATKESDILENVMFSSNIQDDFAICVLSVSLESTLPDEDLIPIYFDEIFQHVMEKFTNGKLRATGAAYDHADAVDYWERTEGYIPDEVTEAVAAEFHRRVNGNDPRPADMSLLTQAVLIWWEFTIGESGDGILSWGEIKDEIVRRYPKMAHPTAGRGYSIRIPHAVGFGGRNRITAIVRVIDNKGHLVYGHLNPEAQEMVTFYFD